MSGFTSMWYGDNFFFSRRAFLRATVASSIGAWAIGQPFGDQIAFAKPGDVDDGGKKPSSKKEIVPDGASRVSSRTFDHLKLAPTSTTTEIRPRPLEVASYFINPTEQRAVGEGRAAAGNAIANFRSVTEPRKGSGFTDWAGVLDVQGGFFGGLDDALNIIDDYGPGKIPKSTLETTGNIGLAFEVASYALGIIEKTVTLQDRGVPLELALPSASVAQAIEYVNERVQNVNAVLGAIGKASQSYGQAAVLDRQILGYRPPKF